MRGLLASTEPAGCQSDNKHIWGGGCGPPGRRRHGAATIFTRQHLNAPVLAPALKKAFGGALTANEQLSKEVATGLLQQGVADAAAFGKAYIANPDLVARFRKLSKGQSDV
jgi:2,4-dienoyl-CoA reductase-like NADH-dependent reductase (Old Yellow Enzyme family)